jgi:uronate dehydrogenase
MQRVLLTGAAGRLGRILRSGLAKSERLLRLLDIANFGSPSEREEIWNADATNVAEMVKAMNGVDVVVHLAVYPEEAPWETIFPLNYFLTYAVLEAARRAGVNRVVFASSVQAVGFHPLEVWTVSSVRARGIV